MQEQIERALAAARSGHLDEAMDALSGLTGDRIDAARFAASRGNVEETVEHLTVELAVLKAEHLSAEPAPAPKRAFGRM